ncbi:hypothetical protein PIB30_065486 [Stylosanthes scabra]|uniref:Uncharacterized protein n=1 Tax=Stylosanthes scabra TaxID=79078 RepID=A0ABU6SMI3_9FABA|nr:hypothetical protein [Stylosanthes scabra]
MTSTHLRVADPIAMRSYTLKKAVRLTRGSFLTWPQKPPHDQPQHVTACIGVPCRYTAPTYFLEEETAHWIWAVKEVDFKVLIATMWFALLMILVKNVYLMGQSIKDLQNGRHFVGLSTSLLHGCLFWLQPDSHASTRSREDLVHYSEGKLLLHSYAIWTQECEGNLPEIDE